MSIWGWVGAIIIAGLMLVILVPMFIHELKWRRRDRAPRD